jgi:exodeoxyribonuclease VII small subunit
MATDANCDELTFEQALGQLEQIVRKLEEGQLGLSDSLAHYETGVHHLKLCYDALAKAERKIELLSGVDAAGNPITTPFDDTNLPLEDKAGARSRRRSAKPAKSPPPAPSAAEDIDDPPGLF